MNYRLLTAFLRLQLAKDGIEEERFGQGAFHVALVVDDGPGNGEDAETLGEVGEFSGLDAVRAHKLTFHGELIRQAHGRRAVGSGGGGEDLQVQRLGELS